jgi:hypothetical protein
LLPQCSRTISQNLLLDILLLNKRKFFRQLTLAEVSAFPLLRRATDDQRPVAENEKEFSESLRKAIESVNIGMLNIG